ncbi:jg26580, partial [Pararge aegeria aegeria]
MAAKTSEWRPGPTVCRCCLSEGCYKDISTEYFWMGKREVYSEMLSETLDLTSCNNNHSSQISYSKSGGPNSQSRLICEPCIARLRDASDFKRQVQECEKTFVQCLDPATALNDLQ